MGMALFTTSHSEEMFNLKQTFWFSLCFKAHFVWAFGVWWVLETSCHVGSCLCWCGHVCGLMCKLAVLTSRLSLFLMSSFGEQLAWLIDGTHPPHIKETSAANKRTTSLARTECILSCSVGLFNNSGIGRWLCLIIRTLSESYLCVCFCLGTHFHSKNCQMVLCSVPHVCSSTWFWRVLLQTSGSVQSVL